MWIKNLFLKDFGCYRHENIEGFSPGLNVIAGPQRAGKSTFREVIRYLGYDIPPQANVPPPTDKERGYRVEADLVVNEDTAHLNRSGNKRPDITGIDHSLEQVYGGLSGLRYRLLFTISLEELQRVPPLAADREELELQAVLIGGGWADVVRVPRIKEEFEKEAKKIAGKRGDFSYELKELGTALTEAIQRREAARNQVEEYRKTIEELAEKDSRIKELEELKKERERERNRLTVLADNYESYSSYLQARGQLDDEAMKLLEQYPPGGVSVVQELLDELSDLWERLKNKRQNWEQVSPGSAAGEIRDVLAERGEEITKFNRTLSGWREQLKNLREYESDYKHNQDELEKKLRFLGSQWQQQPEKLEEVELDFEKRQKLAALGCKYEKMSDEISSLERDLREAEDELERMPESDPDKASSFYPIAAFSALFIFLLALFAAVTMFPFWAGGAAVVAAALIAYFGWRSYSQIEKRRLCQELEFRRQELTKAAEQYRKALAEGKKELSGLEEEFRKMAADFNLPENVAPDRVDEYCRQINEARESYNALKSLEEKINTERRSLKEELSAAVKLLNCFSGTSLPENVIDGAEEIFRGIENKQELLEVHNELCVVEKEWDNFKNRVEKLLRRAPGVELEEGDNWSAEELREGLLEFKELGERREKLGAIEERKKKAMAKLEAALNQESARLAFDEPGDSSELLSAFDKFWQKYSRLSQVKEEQSEVKKELEELKEELKQLCEEKRQLSTQKEELATDEKLRQANRRINEARSKILPRLEEYAVNKIAARLSNRLYRRYVRRTRSGLLEDAGEIFAELTDEDYLGVSPCEEDPEKLEFYAERADQVKQLTGELSRGTREQLFLSVRLARIFNIEPSLPVLLDDSAVNFDPSHRERTAVVLEKLARRNQTFILTAHPEIVELVDRVASSPSYWFLDSEHKFTSHSQASPLIDGLSPG